MIFTTAITTILTLFLSVWCLLMSRRPRHWRLWWLSHLRQIDMHSNSAQRRQQDATFRILVFMAFVLGSLTTVFGAYWTWSQWSENRRQHEGNVDDGIFLKQEAVRSKAPTRSQD